MNIISYRYYLSFQVYKKIWVLEGGECDAMRVIYRMRGLLGDATEEFVETLNASSEQEVNNEEVYKMANVLADCGGLQVMLDRLAAIHDVNRARPLLQVLLKLFRLCVKVKKNQEVLSKPELGAVTVFLDVLQRCLATESENSQAKITEQLLDVSVISHKDTRDVLCYLARDTIVSLDDKEDIFTMSNTFDIVFRLWKRYWRTRHRNHSVHSKHFRALSVVRNISRHSYHVRNPRQSGKALACSRTSQESWRH